MRFGYVVPNSWGVPDLRDVVALGVHAEALGVGALWVSHHVLHVGFVRERLGTAPYHDPLVTLTLLAVATERVRIGTSVMVLPYVHPVTTAKTVAVIDDLSHGRMVYGVGAGGLEVEAEAIGQVPFARRGQWTDESITVARDLWSPGPGSVQGAFVTYTDVEAYPVPTRPGGIPIVVGGGSEAAYRRAALRGDGWHGIAKVPADAAVAAAHVRELRADAGRSTDGFECHIRLHIPIDDDDPGRWVERITAYAEAGIDELLLAPQSGDVAAQRAWLDRVAPPVLDHLGHG